MRRFALITLGVLVACDTMPADLEIVEKALPAQAERYTPPAKVRTFNAECERALNSGIILHSPCYGANYCGDGGCIKNAVFVTLQAGREESFLTRLDRSLIRDVRSLTNVGPEDIPASDDHPCHWYLEVSSREGGPVFGLPRPEAIAGKPTYCVATISGAETETVLHIRDMGPSIVADAFLDGSGAGSLALFASAPTGIQEVSQRALFEATQEGVARLFGQACAPGPAFSCTSVLRLDGVTELVLRFYGMGGLGRAEHWHEAVLEVRQEAGPLMQVGMPITKLRRWPDPDTAPSEGYQSVDRDPDFEAVRRALVQHIFDVLAS